MSRSHESPDSLDTIEGALSEDALSEGQRRRIRLFQTVEQGVSSRIEELCAAQPIEVTDVAVLVASAAAHPIVFGSEAKSTSVVLGHRSKLHKLLTELLPREADTPSDPFEDLLAPAPAGCVRVLIIDDESLTVLSFGTFVTVRMDPDQVPEA